jgi:tetratricopeptide (TPR) repeat protein
MLPGYPLPEFFLNNESVPLSDEERTRPEPRTAVGNKERADEHILKGRVHHAITCYKRAARIENTPEHRTDLGDAYAYAELPVNALKQYRKALKNGPRSADAHFSLAEIYTRYGRWQGAAHEYEKAVEYEPDNAFYRHKLAAAYTQMTLTPKALEQMEVAVDLRDCTRSFNGMKTPRLRWSTRSG